MEWEWQEINETKWSLSSIVNKTVIGYYMNGDLIWKDNKKSKVDTFLPQLASSKICKLIFRKKDFCDNYIISCIFIYINQVFNSYHLSKKPAAY